jgi:Fe-S-cluster-containing hydrogenase component 2
MKAISKEQSTGIVKIDPEKCIGCGLCINVCPFGGIHIDLVKNIAIKCDLCDGDPECIKWCAYEALRFSENNVKEKWKYAEERSRLLNSKREYKERIKGMQVSLASRGGGK